MKEKKETKKKGAKKKPFDKKLFERCCSSGCQLKQTCEILGMNKDTLYSRIKETYGKEYTYEDIRKKIYGGKYILQLREAQFEAALIDRNPTMLKYLGQLYLEEQSEKPIEIKHTLMDKTLENMEEEELQKLLLTLIEKKASIEEE